MVWEKRPPIPQLMMQLQRQCARVVSVSLTSAMGADHVKRADNGNQPRIR